MSIVSTSEQRLCFMEFVTLTYTSGETPRVSDISISAMDLSGLKVN